MTYLMSNVTNNFRKWQMGKINIPLFVYCFLFVGFGFPRLSFFLYCSAHLLYNYLNLASYIFNLFFMISWSAERAYTFHYFLFVEVRMTPYLVDLLWYKEWLLLCMYFLCSFFPISNTESAFLHYLFWLLMLMTFNNNNNLPFSCEDSPRSLRFLLEIYLFF